MDGRVPVGFRGCVSERLNLLLSCDVGVAVPSLGVPIDEVGLFTRHLVGSQDTYQ